LQLSGSLSKKIVRGGLWAFSLRIIGRLLGFVRTVILARLLVPEDFGLLGIAILAINFLETASQTGFYSALIQKKDNAESYFDTAWTVSAIRGTSLFIVLFVSAPALAAFFNSPQATLVIRVVGISSLLTGLRNIGIVTFQKNLEFHKQFIYDLPATLIDLIVSISLAFILRNVWALVWGGLVGNCGRLILSFILHPYRPKIKFAKAQFEELFGFGKWLLGSSILAFLITQGDNVFVGKMLGVTLLGLYQMAYLLAHLPSSEISYVISQVIFPAYSKMQDDIPSLREGYLKILHITLFLTAALSALIFALAPDFTAIFLGDKWISMVSAMQILVIAAFVATISETSGLIFLAVGKPKVETAIQLLRLSVLAIFIYPLSLRWGITGTSIAVLLSIAVSGLSLTLLTIKITGCGLQRFGRRTAIPIINGIIAVVIIFGMKRSFRPGVLFFLTSCSAGIISYLFMSYLAGRLFAYNIWSVVEEAFVSLRSK
jgi:O-antigen/teichoic acid export membrane protein